jgi:DNA adenine methylase
MLTLKSKIKTPISYYGGKQTLVSKILPLIPDHKIYTEPFLGGGAVFWAKKPSPVECINDMNNSIVAFYRVIKSDFAILRKLVLETPSSRKIHNETEFILNNTEHFSDIKIAWAVWVQCNMSFSSNMMAGYGYAVQKNSHTKKIFNKKKSFKKALTDRLELVDIECNDALKIITSRDTADTFHYVDPPYYNSNMGHYGGYTEQDFKNLLSVLSEIKGKFLLSSYNSDILSEYTQKFGWHKIEITKPIVACKGDRTKTKTEVLTANYPI